MITTRTRCVTCAASGHDMTESTFYTINGTNEPVCHPHAVTLEQRHPEYTFQPITPDRAAYLAAS